MAVDYYPFPDGLLHDLEVPTKPGPWLHGALQSISEATFCLWTRACRNGYVPELPTSRDELGPISTTDSLSMRDARIFLARSSAFIEKRIGHPSGAFAIG